MASVMALEPDWGPRVRSILRIMVGLLFLEHGLAKLNKGPDAFAGILHAIGVPGPQLMGKKIITDNLKVSLLFWAHSCRLPVCQWPPSYW